MSVADNWIKPTWNAPTNVHAFTTTRLGGVSEGVYQGLNLGDHVDDAPLAVARNRQLVGDVMQLPSEPLWLKQVHGIDVQHSGAATCYPTADASVADSPKRVCVVMTADCLPVLFCNKTGTVVAAAHAGWRGLCDDVLEETIKTMGVDASEVMAWLGPAIGADAFEVGGEVREAFITKAAEAEQAFTLAHAENKWLGNLYLLARQRLQALGVTDISGGDYCTYSDAERFFSYRRDGQTGRMGSFIWLN